MEFEVPESAPRASSGPPAGPSTADSARPGSGMLDLFEPPTETPPSVRWANRSFLEPARVATREAASRPAAGMGRVGRFGRRLIAGSAKGLFIVVLLWGLLFNFSEVRGSSMEPGIHDRDRILVDHVSYLFSEARRGDIVVLRYPLDPSLDYIKRVVGLPGDEVVIRGQQVFVNGTLCNEPYVADEIADPYTYMSAVVRPGHVFVLGDNRLRSSDSREFGQVPTELLRGKVRFRLWPLARAGWVD